MQETKDTKKSKPIINGNLIKNISILSSLLFLGIILMVIVNYYEKQDLEMGETTSAAQILGN